MKKINQTTLLFTICLSLLSLSIYAGRCSVVTFCPNGTMIGCAGEVECYSEGGVINCDGVENDCGTGVDPEE